MIKSIELKSKLTLIVVTTVAITLAGCAAPPSQTTEITFNSAGPKPTIQAIETSIQKFLAETLKDPDSVKQFRILSGPDFMTWHRGSYAGGGYETAWLVCYQLNAKNSFGAYVGVRTDSFVVQNKPAGLLAVSTVNWSAADRHC